MVSAGAGSGKLRVSVTDSGGRPRLEPRRRGATRLAARLSGRRLHGHGLRLVRRTAAAHGGEFGLHTSGRGAVAVLELPLASASAA